MTYKLNKKQLKATRLLISTYFKNREKKPYHPTDGQCEIFAAILDKRIKWLWVSAPTRYGKSDDVAMALLFAAAFLNLKIPIVAGSADKARKIMDYIIEHVADHEELYQGLVNVKGLAEIERLKVSVSKDTLRWAGGGWILVTSVDSRNISKEGEGVVGEGGDIVVLEEAGLIKHKEQFSKIVRMPERNRGWGKLVMAGNCVEGSVFEDAYKDPMYVKVRISLAQAVKEGRYSIGELREKKAQTTKKDWKRYYLVIFPKKGEFTYFQPRKYEYVPKDLKYFGALDLAMGKAKKGSLIGIVVLGQSASSGQVYEVMNIGEHLKPNDTIRRVFNLPFTFERFVIEEVQFQSYFIQVIEDLSKKEGRYIPFEGIHQKRAKEERIESLEPAINTGQILFSGDGELWDEMEEYPNAENLDVIDALEMAWRTIRGDSFDFTFV